MSDSLSRARLQWLMDNEPEWVQELYEKKRLPELEKSILNTVIPAWQALNAQVEKGVPYAVAHDQALQAVTPKDGPEFGDDPPKPLPLKLQMKILQILEDREEFRDRQERLKAKNTSTNG